MKNKIPVINWIIIASFMVCGIGMAAISYIFKLYNNTYGTVWFRRMGVICLAVSIFTYMISKIISNTKNTEIKSANGSETTVYVHKDTENWHREMDRMEKKRRRHIKKGQRIQMYYVTDNPWITIPAVVFFSLFFLLLGVLIAALSPLLGLFWVIIIFMFFVHQMKQISKRIKERKESGRK